MYIIEQIFSQHGYEYLVVVLSIFVFIIIFKIFEEGKKY